jgi:RNA ligase
MPEPIVFVPMPKIPRLTRDCTITEKIDGTNASICIGENGEFLIGSRTRWITPLDDNYGFAKWAYANKEELLRLGPGHHFGEWWGLGIQRNYGQDRKRFSLFNSFKWKDDAVRPTCCDVVPVLYEGTFDTEDITTVLEDLMVDGSKASPGFMNPEGLMIYHHAAKQYFKKTILKDEKGKGE